jgi:hypothetical protein
MWKTHFMICAVVLMLAIPVYFAEGALLKKGSGGFISLDFTGIIIVPYLIFVGLHILISSISVKLLTPASLLPVHAVSAAASFGLLAVGFFGFMSYNRWQERRQMAAEDKRVEQKRGIIQLKEWWYVPDAQNPQEIHVTIKFAQAGRFAGHAFGEALGDYPERIFYSEDVPQRMVGQGEEITQVFPLVISKKGEAPSVSIGLSLFKKKQGPDMDDVIVVYETNVLTDHDGWTIYEQLPLPSTKQ